jgi:hypothetical protein
MNEINYFVPRPPVQELSNVAIKNHTTALCEAYEAGIRLIPIVEPKKRSGSVLSMGSLALQGRAIDDSSAYL